MSRASLALMICLATLPALAAAGDAGVTPIRLFVALDGNDAWSGTLPSPGADKTDGPFATLARARDEIREQKAAGKGGVPFEVSIRGGVYCLNETFTLTGEDSGSPDAPIVYQAYLGEKPVLVGGRRVTGFVPHKGEIRKADVGSQGLGGVCFRQLFFDGKRQHLARFPNFDPADPYAGGWSYADGKPVPMYAEVPGEDRRTLAVKPGDLHEWSRVTEGQVLVFPRYNWWNNLLGIASLDRASGVMKLAGDASYPIRPGDRYFVRNLFEELDSPGEWYLDRATWTLYFWPPSPIDQGAVYVPTLETVVAMTGARHITLDGLTIECCEGTAVRMRDCSQCRVMASTIRNVGGRCSSAVAAVSISGGSYCGVIGCDIYEVGSHAVSLSGGDRETLMPACHYAENNYIHHTGVFYKQGVGVAISGVGSRASHNLIHDCPRFAFLYGGNDHLIELNHVRHVDLETADTGATYSGGRDWLSPRGTVIRYNYIHDVFGFGKEDGRWTTPHYCWGIYLDDNSAEVHVYGNIVVRALRGLLHFHCARDNLVENNVFVDGLWQQIEMNGWDSYSQFLDQMGPAYESHVNLPAWEKYPGLQQGGHPKDAVPMAGNRIRRNIIYYHNPEAMLYKHRRLRPEHFECDGNLVYHFGHPLLVSLPNVEPEKQWAAWQKLGFDRHSLVADPLFVDPEHDDYRLRPDSPAFKLGFEPIPVDKIGPYQSPHRASWPIVEAPGAREAGYARATLEGRSK
jgi:hypothetical protein